MLFQGVDRDGLFTALSSSLFLGLACGYFFGLLFAVVGLVWFFVMLRVLRRDAQQGGYTAIIRERTQSQQTFYPQRRSVAAQGAPPDRWHISAKFLVQSWSFWKKLTTFFRGAERTIKTKHYEPHSHDLPLFGFLHPFPAMFSSSLPTGREILTMLNKRYPAIYRTLFIDSPAEGLPDRLSWRSKPDPRSVRQRDETFVRTWLVRGNDFSAQTLDDRALKTKEPLNATICNLPPGCVLHSRLVTIPSQRERPPKIFDTPEAQLVFDESEAHLRNSVLLETWTELSLTFVPEIADIDGELFSGRSFADPLKNENDRATTMTDISRAAYQTFAGICAQFEESLKPPVFAEFIPLGEYSVPTPPELAERHKEPTILCDAQLESYRFALTGVPAPVLAPHQSVGLYHYLGSHELRVADRYLRIGDMLVSVIEIEQYPHTLVPDVFLSIDGIDSGLSVIASRFIVRRNDEVEKEMDALYRYDVVRSEGKSGETKKVAGMVDALAMEHAEGTMSASALHRERIEIFGHTSLGIVLYEPISADDKEETAAKRLIARRNTLIGALENKLFVIAKTNANQLEAFLSFLPGNWRDNPVHPLLSSGNFVNLLTTTSAWTGDDEISNDPYYVTTAGYRAPNLAYFLAEGGRLFGFNPVYETRGGHTLVAGSTGSGKSTLVDFLILMHTAYNTILPKGAQQIVIDFDGSHRSLATILHGTVRSLGPNTLAGFSLFADLEIKEEDYDGTELPRMALEQMISYQGHSPYTDEWRETIAQILLAQRQRPIEERTMQNALLAAIPQAHRTVLADFAPGGRWNTLFNGVGSADQASPLRVYDIASAYHDERLRPLVMLCLSQEIERVARRAIPTMLAAEEFWVFLRDPKTEQYFESWLRRLRKYGTWVFLITQEPSDLLRASNPKAFFNSFASRIIFPHETANTDDSKEILGKLGLTSYECDYLARIAADASEGGQGSHRAYIITGTRKRLVSTHLQPIAVATCANTSPRARTELARVVAKYPTDAYARWIAARGGEFGPRWAQYFTNTLLPRYVNADEGVFFPPYNVDLLGVSPGDYLA